MLSREDAAHYVGVGTTLFDAMVQAGLMPQPRQLGSKRIAWDIRDLDRAVDELPQANHSSQIVSAIDPYDDVHA
jgi:predicted DNA-binding transcriptional regulator AlpA